MTPRSHTVHVYTNSFIGINNLFSQKCNVVTFPRNLETRNPSTIVVFLVWHWTSRSWHVELKIKNSVRIEAARINLKIQRQTLCWLKLFEVIPSWPFLYRINKSTVTQRNPIRKNQGPCLSASKIKLWLRTSPLSSTGKLSMNLIHFSEQTVIRGRAFSKSEGKMLF